jgi:polysaccharide export outer membrane protein
MRDAAGGQERDGLTTEEKIPMIHLARLSALLAVCLLAVPLATAQTRPTPAPPAAPPPAQTQPAAPTAAPVAGTDYIIGAEDILDIQVWGSNDLNQTVFVRPDGKLSLPLVGEIAVAGKTVQQLQDHLSSVYEKTVKGAVVTVLVEEIRSRPVYFVGGFTKPGVMQLTSELTLLQAVSLVGGITTDADGERGFLLRRDRKVPIDFKRLGQRGDASQNPKLEPGDSIVVPLAEAVWVSGEVKKPGAVKYANDLTVLRALTEAGGLTPLAAGGRVDILRGGDKKKRIRVDVDRVMRSPDSNQDVRLEPNDLINVPQRRF